MPLSIEHERARFAYERVQSYYHQNTNKDVKDKFESWAEKLPSMIVSCGLLQTLVFYKSKEEGKTLYEIMKDWIKKKLNNNDNDFDAVNYLANQVNDMQQYMYLSDESLKLAIWVKRMAKILKE